MRNSVKANWSLNLSQEVGKRENDAQKVGIPPNCGCTGKTRLHWVWGCVTGDRSWGGGMAVTLGEAAAAQSKDKATA